MVDVPTGVQVAIVTLFIVCVFLIRRRWRQQRRHPELRKDKVYRLNDIVHVTIKISDHDDDDA